MAADPEVKLRALVASAIEARGGCLDEQRWEDLATGALGPDDERRALDHVLGCPACAGIHRALSELGAEASAFDPGARRLPGPGAGGGRPRGGRRWVGWVAGSCLLAAAAVLLVARREPQPVRSPAAAPPIALLEPSGMQDRAPALLRWTAPAGARCSAEVRSADGSLVWSSTASEAREAHLPAGLPLAAGRWYWQVDCGPGLGHSAVASFSLR